ALTRDFDGNVSTMAPNLEIDCGSVELQAVKLDVIEERWEARVVEPYLLAFRIELQAERRLDKREGRGAGPGLRRAGDRVEGRSAVGLTTEAAEELGQSAQIHVGRCIEQTLEQGLDLALQAIPREPQGDQRIVVRPDRAVVVGHRIVAGFALGDGANAPAREETRSQQAGRDRGRTVWLNDAGEQELACVRRADTARLLVAVEGNGVGAEIGTPEG